MRNILICRGQNMAYISEEEIKNIQNKANIVDIISSYVSLSKSGSDDYVGICPFHEDHSPSMHVSTKLNIFKCFVCNTGGNVFSFVKKYENVNYIEAVKIVAEKLGVPFNHSIDHVESKYKNEFSIMDLSLLYYQNNIASEKGINAKKYLANRGIDENIIKEFKIGISLDDNSLCKFLQNKNTNLELAYNVGLLNKSGIDYYDTFVNRIMIPIYDMQGNLAGYTARAYLTEEKSKYINSRETAIYKKSSILFNYYKAKEEARNNHEIVIVEGNMDAISMYVNGIKNVIALMGVVISQKQIEAIKKLNSRVVLMLDSDNAGSIATMNVGDELNKAGLDLFVVRLEGSKDPDEYVRKNGVDALKDNIKHAQKYMDFKLDVLKQKYDLTNPSQLADYIKIVLNSLENASEIDREVTIGNIAKEYNLDPAILKRNLASPPEETVKPSTEIVQRKKSKYEMASQELIYAMLLDKNYYKIFLDKLGYLNTKIQRDILNMIDAYIRKKDSISIAEFLDYVEPYEEIRNYIEETITSSRQEVIAEKDFYAILKTVSQCINEEEIKKIKDEIKKTNDVNKKLELIEKLAKLKRGSGLNERN